jgi:uncharacterized protein (UPF0335 family)
MGFDGTDHTHPTTHLPKHTRDILRSLVKRIQNVDEEIAERNTLKADIYDEAKSLGFDKKTLRKLVARLRKPKDVLDEEDMLLELYATAVARDPIEE